MTLVTAAPDVLTLGPGESAQVTVAVDPVSPYGIGSVTICVEVAPPYDGTIQGNFAGVVPAGEHWHIVGDVNLTGDLIVEGLLTGIDTFTVQGNGFTVFFQNGGRADLHGKVKAAWGPWGTDTTGWVTGDRLAIAPAKAGVFVPSELAWSNWSAARPANSPDVTLLDGRVAKPEVLNLSQSIVFENLARGFHFHDSAGVQNLSDVRFLNCGTPGVVGSYSCHFHLLGENSRGSLLERVVVEGGKNNAFVPHGSHGITFKDCAVYKATGAGYWWDYPLNPDHTANNSNDILYDHCLVLMATQIGFDLGAGAGNAVVDSVAACVQGGVNGPGFHWPSSVNQNIGGVVWQFQRNMAHNNKKGIFVWQNDAHPHLIEDFVAYRNKLIQVDHGAYTNNYVYKRLVLMGGSEASFKLHARGGILVEDVLADTPLLIFKHLADATEFVTFRRCQFPSAIYTEMGGTEQALSWIRYDDAGWTPAKFTLTAPNPESIIEIYEAGALTHRWAGGWV